MKANILSCALKIVKNTSSDDSRVITCGFFLNFIQNEGSSHQYKHIHKKRGKKKKEAAQRFVADCAQCPRSGSGRPDGAWGVYWTKWQLPSPRTLREFQRTASSDSARRHVPPPAFQGLALSEREGARQGYLAVSRWALRRLATGQGL